MDWLALLAVSAAAAAAKSLQSCPTLCDPGDGSPPGSPIPGILQARIPYMLIKIRFFKRDIYINKNIKKKLELFSIFANVSNV